VESVLWYDHYCEWRLLAKSKIRTNTGEWPAINLTDSSIKPIYIYIDITAKD
jgi:hypothetical protein